MLVKAAAVKTQARRVLSRPRTLLPAIFVFVVLCLLGLMRHNDQLKQTAPVINDQAPDRDPGMQHLHDAKCVRSSTGC